MGRGIVRTRVRWIALIALLVPALLVGLIALPGVLQAAPVTRHATCAPSGANSLADIVANVAQSGDTIVFDTDCTIALGATVAIPSAKNLTIDANAHTVLLDGGGAVQLLRLQATNNHGPAVTLKGLTLQHGSAPQGGAIFNDQGALTILNSAIVNNAATIGGAGIENAGGTLAVTNSTFSGNRVTGTASASGGAIENNAYGKVTVVSSTIAGNTVSSSAPQSASGGGIFDFSAAAPAAVTLTDTIVAGNTGGNCNGTDIGSANAAGIASGGHNLIGRRHANGADPACGTDFAGNATTGELVGTDAAPIDAKLGPLGNNGGTTPTLPLLLGSPAVDAGGATCPAGVTTDQRGDPRPAGAGCDIGAYESQGFTVQSVAVAGSPTTLKVGDTTQLHATATYSDGSTPDVTNQAQWSSSDATIASVDATGKVTAKAGGSVTITATVGGKPGTATITVTPPVFTGVQPAPAPQSRPSGAGAPTAPATPPAPAPAPRSAP